jgi:hypothetical protein
MLDDPKAGARTHVEEQIAAGELSAADGRRLADGIAALAPDLRLLVAHNRCDLLV